MNSGPTGSSMHLSRIPSIVSNASLSRDQPSISSTGSSCSGLRARQSKNILLVALTGKRIQFSHGIQVLAKAVTLELGIVLSQVVTGKLRIFTHLAGQQTAA